jgi:hypothetical protein
MAAVLRPRTEPTQAELVAAWQYCRRSRHTTWPATFDEAMADPILSAVVRLNAKHPPKPVRAAINAPELQPLHQAQQQSSRPAWRPAPSRAPGLDRKRLASGERDDD